MNVPRAALFVPYDAQNLAPARRRQRVEEARLRDHVDNLD
jgi:hypothetical protein